MSITTVGVTHNTQASSANIVFTKPAGVQPGDLLICAAGLAYGGGVQSYTPPTGFTEYADIIESSLSLSAPFFYRIADGSEASTFTAVGANNGQGGVGCCAYRGVHQVTPILAVSPVTDDGSGGTSTTVQAVSWAGAAEAVSMILIVSQKTGSSPVPVFPAGWDISGVDGFTDNDGLIWGSLGVNLTPHPGVVSLPSQTVTFPFCIDANAQFAIQAAPAAPSTGLQLELGPLARRFA